MVEGLIVGHGDYGAGLIHAIELISGATSNLEALSNTGLSTNELSGEISSRIAKHPDSDFIMFVDVFGGSCWRAAMMAKTERSRVVTGVNLPMLLSFMNKRETEPFETLADTLVNDLKRSATVN